MKRKAKDPSCKKRGTKERKEGVSELSLSSSPAPSLESLCLLHLSPTSQIIEPSRETEVQEQETHELLDDGLDEGGEGEPLGGLRIPDVLAEDGDGFGVGFGFEVVSSLLENELELLVCEGREEVRGSLGR